MAALGPPIKNLPFEEEAIRLAGELGISRVVIKPADQEQGPAGVFAV